MALTYDDLRICAALKREAEDLKEQIERLRSVLEGRPRVLTFDPKGTPPDMEDMVAALLELEELYRERVCRYAEHVYAVEAAISTIRESDQRRIVRYRFVDGLRWRDVAKKMIMDKRWCERLCEKALRNMGIQN